MLNDYMDHALQHAQYEQIEDGTYFGTIPGFEGLWSNGVTPQECVAELRDVLEGWILLGIAQHEPLPVVDGITITVGKIA